MIRMKTEFRFHLLPDWSDSDDLSHRCDSQCVTIEVISEFSKLSLNALQRLMRVGRKEKWKIRQTIKLVATLTIEQNAENHFCNHLAHSVWPDKRLFIIGHPSAPFGTFRGMPIKSSTISRCSLIIVALACKKAFCNSLKLAKFANLLRVRMFKTLERL